MTEADDFSAFFRSALVEYGRVEAEHPTWSPDQIADELFGVDGGD